MTPEYIEILLKLTKVSSREVVAATIDHLSNGLSQLDAAAAHGVKQESVARLVKRLRELDAIVVEAITVKLKI